MLAIEIQSKGHVWERKADGTLIEQPGSTAPHTPIVRCCVCGMKVCAQCFSRKHEPLPLPPCKGFYLPREGS